MKAQELSAYFFRNLMIQEMQRMLFMSLMGKSSATRGINEFSAYLNSGFQFTTR